MKAKAVVASGMVWQVGDGRSLPMPIRSAITSTIIRANIPNKLVWQFTKNEDLYHLFFWVRGQEEFGSIPSFVLEQMHIYEANFDVANWFFICLSINTPTDINDMCSPALFCAIMDDWNRAFTDDVEVTDEQMENDSTPIAPETMWINPPLGWSMRDAPKIDLALNQAAKNYGVLGSGIPFGNPLCIAGKIKTTEFGKSNFGFELEPPTNQVLWASPQNSQLMALLRAAQNQNPNPNPSSVAIKEEGAMVGSYMSDSALGTSALNARPTGVDHVSQVPVGLYNSFWRNNQDQPQTQQHHHNQNQQHQQHSLLMGDVQNSGIQELFNRLRSSGNYYSNHSHPQFSNEASSTSSPSSTVMEPSPITGGEVGYWNPTLSWANLPTANGAFP
ncbi:hypothetical protein IFM89_011141 [Coptis chinensis]|uniref:Uncharacterized protein n=1 Tax=Coptis chinensis TaxID=261450 RepID=A0A835HLR1_9MAGN|nr:hypothetical protein IFM89_011141 [Coptis chinensis]